MEIKDQLEALKESISNKLVAGEYEITEVKEYTTTVILEGNFSIELWTGNGVDNFGVDMGVVWGGLESLKHLISNRQDKLRVWEDITAATRTARREKVEEELKRLNAALKEL